VREAVLDEITQNLKEAESSPGREPEDGVRENGAVESEQQEISSEVAASVGDDLAVENDLAAEREDAPNEGEQDLSRQILDEDIIHEGEEVEEEVVAPRGPIELVDTSQDDIQMDWYILKVQSNRERSITDALERKVAIEGLDRYFGQILVPTEKVTEFKAGKKKIVERKLWPGYIVVQMHLNDDTWFAVRETAGIGDFTGAAGKPAPMLPEEIAKILQSEEEETDDAPKLKLKFQPGDKVKIKEGNFESFEGEVHAIDEASGRVTVMISIFGRSTPVEFDYWQVEAV
jgi:transcription termination/antitermination protein NusG